MHKNDQKQTKRPSQTYTKEEVADLIHAIPTRSVTGLRNRALVMVLYRAGLRCAEALSLRPCDLDRRQGTVRVLHGKGDRARTVAMDDSAFEFIDRWIDARNKLGVGGSCPLFCTKNGGLIPTSYIRKLLPRLKKRAGIEKRIHAHGFRHTMACEMRAEGRDIGYISKQLGHEHVSTTSTYLDNMRPEGLIDVMRRRKIDRDLFFPEEKRKKKR